MINKKYDKYILDCFFNKDGAIWSNRIKYLEQGHKIIKSSYQKKHRDYIIKYYNNIKEYLLQRYNDIPSDLFSYNEVIKRIKYNINTRPVCPVCNKPLEFIGRVKKLYPSHCSNSCRSKHINIHFWRNAIKDYKFGSEQLKKREQTCLVRYGTNYPSQLKEVKEKVYKSKISHKSYTKSIQEDKTYYKLIELFGYKNIERQHKDEYYPYCCDFYINSEDLYIECNYHWTHGTHPFNINNKKDIELYNKLKNHNNKYSPSCGIWGCRDIIKLNCMKYNKYHYNKNYLVFYSPKEFNDWYYSFGI